MFVAARRHLSPTGEIPAEALEEMALWGTLEQICGRIRSLHTAGIDEVVLNLTPVDDPARDTEHAHHFRG